MFSNYFKTAFRSLIRNRSYAAINIIGLAVGIAACLLIFLVVQFETSFDQFHSQKNKIYRVVSQSKTADGVNYSSGVPFPVAGSLRIDFPQLENVAAIFAKDDPEIIIPAGDHHQTIKKFKEEQVFFTEPQFFKVFDFNWLAGDQKTALAEPNTALLSKETAKKYFGDWTKAIDQTIKYDNKYLVRITGVLEDVPANSDFPLRLVISYATLNNTDLKTNLDDWNTIFSDAYCFVVLPSTLPAARFDNWLVDFAKRHQTGKNARDMGMILQPLREMHYDSRFGVFSNHIFGKDILTAISLIGLFLLIIACSNFINLATAQAVNRSKEVGVRKVLGCRRAHLISQFMAETFLITLFAMALAIVITFTILPLLNELLQIQLHFKILSDPAIILFIAFTIGVVGILSGIYPAFVLSGFNPIQSLKIKITPKSAGGIPLRRILVIMQFCIAQVLIMGTLVVVSQMDYLRNAPLGFSKDAIINIPIPQDSSDLHKLGALRNQLLQQPGIRNISFCFSSPSADGNWNSDFNFDHATKRTDFSANLKWADANYFKTYDLHFVAGGPYAAGDTVKGFVVNEMLLQKLGIRTPQEAIGKYLDFWNKTLYAPIVGVIKDFNVRSLRKPIVPVVIGSWQAVYQQASIHVQPADMIPVLEAVEKIWNNDFPDYYFEYHFLDQQIADFYKQERQLTELYKIFAAIAILLSCFGLYGLVSFMTVQRTKEVGIRKVLGASVINILYLLSKEFTVLILSAFVIAAPVAYYLMHRWLLQYTFRISPGADLFLLTMSASLAIAWGTAGYQAFRAALANPVESLRNE